MYSVFAEFVTVFQLNEHIHNTQKSFNGNFTLKVVAGGPTYETMRRYDEDEIQLYNYHPGDT